MQRRELIMITACLAFSTLIGCDSAEVPAEANTTTTSPSITQEAEQPKPTQTEEYVDKLLTVTPTPEPTVAAGEIKTTTINAPDVKSSKEKVKTKKSVAEKAGIKKAHGTKYTNATVNVRKDATVDSKKLATFNINKRVIITGKVNNGWTRISYKDGVAYVKTKHLSEDKTEIKHSSSSSSKSTAHHKKSSSTTKSTKHSSSSKSSSSWSFKTDNSKVSSAENDLKKNGYDGLDDYGGDYTIEQ